MFFFISDYILSLMEILGLGLVTELWAELITSRKVSLLFSSVTSLYIRPIYSYVNPSQLE